MIEIHPLTGVGEVVPGTDLGVLLPSALTTVVAAPVPGVRVAAAALAFADALRR